MTARVSELVSGRVPFVHATVVRAQFPTSAQPGDDAIVLADGSIEGFVGGQCAEGSVRVAALAALRDGESTLLRVLPDGDASFPQSPGAQVVVNPCLSGGALEIFIEPLLPPPLLFVVGAMPIADAICAMGESLGFAVARAGPEIRPDGATAVIVSSHGRDEVAQIRAALDAGVAFIGLVASRRRGEAVLAEMHLTEAERARVHTPVGLEIGARTAEEIALSIMAQVVRAVRLEGLAAPAAPATAAETGTPAVAVGSPGEAVDPVCGMTVAIAADTPHLQLAGQDHWFCSTGCRDRYAAQVGR
jgi:xanthine dehydrogenase accessory factor